MQIKTSEPKVQSGVNIDREALERMMKDQNTEDVYLIGKRDGRIVRAKSLWAKTLIRQDKARFICTAKEAKAKGIRADDYDKFVKLDEANKVIKINY